MAHMVKSGQLRENMDKNGILGQNKALFAPNQIGANNNLT